MNPTELDQMIAAGYRGDFREGPGVADETRTAERRVPVLRGSSWRAHVENRVTVCCDYGNAGQRTTAVY
jgi:hypothetical protein